MHAKDLFAVVSLIDSVLSIAVGTLSLIDRLTAKRKTAKHYRKTNHK